MVDGCKAKQKNPVPRFFLSKESPFVSQLRIPMLLILFPIPIGFDSIQQCKNISILLLQERLW